MDLKDSRDLVLMISVGSWLKEYEKNTKSRRRSQLYLGSGGSRFKCLRLSRLWVLNIRPGTPSVSPEHGFRGSSDYMGMDSRASKFERQL